MGCLDAVFQLSRTHPSLEGAHTYEAHILFCEGLEVVLMYISDKGRGHVLVASAQLASVILNHAHAWKLFDES